MTRIKASAQVGYTLIELMIALTIGVFLTGGLLNLYIGSKKAYNQQSVLVELQEVGRFSVQSMVSDIRMAGFLGCGQSLGVVNVLNGGAASWELNAGQALRGFEGGSSVFPADFAANVVGASDALVLVRTIPEDRYVVQSHATAAATITLQAAHDLQQGDVLAVTDCLNTAVFQQTNVNAGNTATTIEHTSGVGTPGNCTNGLGSPLDCSSTAGTVYQFATDSFVTRVVSRAYYVGTAVSGRPALFRLDMNNNGTLGAPVQMAEGIADMQLVYGIDTNNDDAVDAYQQADAIAVADWPNVISVQVNLLVESQETTAADDPVSYVLYDGTAGSLVPITPTDRALRRVYSATTTIRNRAVL